MNEPTTPDLQDSCPCMQGIFHYPNFKRTHLGGDSFDGKVDLITCTTCGRYWLSIFYEPKVYDDTGRVYYGLISPEAIPSISQGDVLENALKYFASLDWYYCNGTYWSNRGIKVPFKRHGKIILF